MSVKRSKKTPVAKELQILKQSLRRMGVAPETYDRFVNKADAVIRELNTTPRNGKRLNKVVAELLSEFVALDSENDAE